MSERLFTIGVEEEYLLIDAETFELAEATEDMISACKDTLGDNVSPEFMRCQIEVGTKVCGNIADARSDLTRLRRTVAEVAEGYGLRPVSVSCHPSAVWTEQTHRDRARYNELRDEVRAVADRMLISGMHVHVGIPDENDRIDLMNQFSYFLPHLLALSASSPFWRGEDTGLASYRIGVFDDMPRSGLPPRLAGWSAWRGIVETFAAAGVTDDASKIWWDLRPSDAYPTLETRICDACPRIEHTLTLAATIQSTLRMLWRLKARNLRWRLHEPALIAENRWRARRYGTTEGMIDVGRAEIRPMPELVGEWIEMIAEDADALGCRSEVEGLRDMAASTSSDRQRAIFTKAVDSGESEDTALRAVVESLADDFLPEE